MLLKIAGLETQIEVCDKNVAACESNLRKEKDFAIFQKEKNRRLKKVIADTRKNNQILKNELAKNQCVDINDIIHQNEIEKFKVTVANLEKQNEELKIRVEKLKEERNAEINKRDQCQADNVENLKLVLKLKTTESKLISDLENCKTSEADLAISNQELKDCKQELEVEIKKNRQCKSDKKICEDETVSKDQQILELESKNSKITSELENETAKYTIAKQELRDCKENMDGYQSRDINECENNPCPRGTQCKNTFGSYTCDDVDECASGTHNCPNNQICKNTHGSYSCQIPCQ